MALPPPPYLRPKQRHGRRFWRTDDMMELLSLYWGSTKEAYPKSWQYRTLIAVHREQQTHNAYRRGYGPDWKASIKREVLEYTTSGRLPLDALRLAAKGIRMMERRMWATSVAERRVLQKPVYILEAAE